MGGCVNGWMGIGTIAGNSMHHGTVGIFNTDCDCDCDCDWDCDWDSDKLSPGLGSGIRDSRIKYPRSRTTFPRPSDDTSPVKLDLSPGLLRTLEPFSHTPKGTPTDIPT